MSIPLTIPVFLCSLIEPLNVLLPSEYYTLDGEVSMAPEVGYDKIKVSFSSEQVTAVRELNAALEEPKIYCLALKLVSDDVTVFDGKGTIIRRLDVILPQLCFAEAGVQQKKLYDAKQEVSFDFTVARGDSDLELPVESQLVPLSQAELSEIDPQYMLIPAEYYTLSASDIVVPAGEEEISLSAVFSGEQISDIRELAETQSKQACLALKIESDNVDAVEGRGMLLYVMDITQPTLHFELVSGATPNRYRQWWWDNRHDDGS